MNRRKRLLWFTLALIALASSVIAIYLGPSVYFGIRERQAIRQLQKSNAPLSAYRQLLGSPEGEYTSFSAYHGQYGHRALKFPDAEATESSTTPEGRFLYWAKTSLPYYYVLIIAETEDSPPVKVYVFRAGQ